MNSMMHGGDIILRRELEQHIRTEVRRESAQTLTPLQFEREVKKRLKEQMPSSITLY
jgi:hypothetical protein